MKLTMITKRIISTIFALGVVTSIASAAGATGPQFNMLSGDSEFLTGRNVTQNQTVTSDPVTAKTTDQVEGVIYYHNGVANSTATNVRAAVTLPTGQSTTQVLQASLAADNATTITDTVVNGQVVGKSGLTINLNTAATVQAVPGSVRWFPDGSQTAVALPNSQTGAELFTATGLSIGDIQGCWAHAGYIMFKVQFVTPVPGTPQINQSKSAFNDTQSKDATTTIAHAGDQITYTLVTKNSGTATAAGYVVTDGVRDILDYADVTSVSDGGSLVNQTNTAVRDDQVMVTYPATDIAAGATITRTFVIKVKNPIPTNPQNGTAFDFVMFNRYGNAVVIQIEHPGNAVIQLQKSVRDVTTSETTFVHQDTAHPGDTLQYQIILSNTGTVATDVTLQDILPTGTTFVDGSIAAQINGTAITVSQELVNAGAPILALQPNATATVLLSAITDSNLADGTTLVNVAKASTTGQSLQATAITTIVVKPVVVVPTQSTTLPRTGASSFDAILPLAGLAYTAFIRLQTTRRLKLALARNAIV